jgi:hypothetical protein
MVWQDRSHRTFYLLMPQALPEQQGGHQRVIRHRSGHQRFRSGGAGESGSIFTLTADGRGSPNNNAEIVSIRLGHFNGQHHHGAFRQTSSQRARTRRVSVTRLADSMSSPFESSLSQPLQDRLYIQRGRSSKQSLGSLQNDAWDIKRAFEVHDFLNLEGSFSSRDARRSPEMTLP